MAKIPDPSKINYVLDDDLVIAMAKIGRVYEPMIRARKESGSFCGSVVLRVANPFGVSEFEYFYGRDAYKDNGWTVAFVFVKDFGSVKACEDALDELRERINAEPPL